MRPGHGLLGPGGGAEPRARGGGVGDAEAQDSGTEEAEGQERDCKPEDAGTGDPEGQDARGLGTWTFGAWRVGRPSGPSGVNPALIARLPYRGVTFRSVCR